MSKVIFGDNEEVLKSEFLSIFQNRIKMIYIDPPYNTCTKKAYEDGVSSEYWHKSLFNILKLLHLYLREDGVIFISIDDNEQAYLKVLCDGIFGKVNFVGTFITKQAQRSNSKYINVTHEYILCYSKNKKKLKNFSIKRINIPEQRKMIEHLILQIKKEFIQGGINKAENKLKELIDFYCKKYHITWLKNYRCVDEDGNIYFPSDLSVPGKPREVNIESINLHLSPLPTRNWSTDKKFIELYRSNMLCFKNGRPYEKKLLINSTDNVSSILNFYSRQGTNDLNRLGLRDVFDTPKPVELIKFLIRISGVSKNEYVLDCYAGSGTTGQAVIEINTEDNNEVEFILIQKIEKIDEKTRIFEVCKQYGINPFISEITKIRIDKVCEKHNISHVEYYNYDGINTKR